jgi:predicted  nucleic acid-binding Zn-ribbon protein
MLAGCQGASQQSKAMAPPDVGQVAPHDVDQLMIVDCLLPGQVRKLGAMTYMTARRPVQAPAGECAIRGGEYVAFDRSNYATALKVWLPQAEAGDAAAQNMVGEIYVKGLGAAPQYDLAAKWFKRAAEQDYARAKVNLGYLYEQGLGVSRDSLLALNLYREASGFKEALAVDQSDLIAAQQEELSTLKQSMAEREAEIEGLRRRLRQIEGERETLEKQYQRQQGAIENQRRALASTRADLARQLAAHTNVDPGRIQSLESALAQKETVIAIQRREAIELQAEIGRLAAFEGGGQTEEVTRLRATLAKRETELNRHREEATRVEREMADLMQERSGIPPEAQARIRQLEVDLAAKQGLLDREKQRAQRLDTDLVALTARAADYEQRLVQQQRQLENLPGPAIEIIDPRLLATRGMRILPSEPGTAKRRIIGRVNAPAGIARFTVNDSPTELEPSGHFRVYIPVTRSANTTVRMLAVDTRGKQGRLELTIPWENPQPVTNVVAKRYRALPFGRYHALLIGNNDYGHYPQLSSAINDVQTIGAILEDKYGFKVRILTNASRFEILSALDGYRQQLAEGDNFMLYYAGHGELDEKNRRGYWIPVDADPDSRINHIPNFAITDVLNNMATRQAMIIADTCYSGIMTRSAINRDRGDFSPAKRLEWLKEVVESRSRTVLSSGGLKPVLDAGMGKHSVFARALIDTLQSNDTILEASHLHQKIAAIVTYNSRELGLEQTPQYAANLHAGHEAGDFLFVPADYRAAGLQEAIPAILHAAR